MLIKEHVGFLLFHELQRLSSECENPAWAGIPTTRLSLEAVRGGWGWGPYSAVLKFAHIGLMSKNITSYWLHCW